MFVTLRILPHPGMLYQGSVGWPEECGLLSQGLHYTGIRRDLGSACISTDLLCIQCSSRDGNILFVSGQI